MKLSWVVIVIHAIIFFSSSGWAGGWDKTLKQYDCLEVEKFFVDRDDFSSSKMERAAAVPQETLDGLQHKIVGQVSRAKIFSKVGKAGQVSCPGKVLVFGGQVTDYKRGSRAARLLIGLGAGKQKFATKSYLKDKETEKVLAKKKIVDRKVGGLAGGDEDKGQRDFAEKVAKFVKNGD